MIKSGRSTLSQIPLAETSTPLLCQTNRKINLNSVDFFLSLSAKLSYSELTVFKISLYLKMELTARYEYNWLASHVCREQKVQAKNLVMTRPKPCRNQFKSRND